jgi:hypothetical protein
MVLGILFATSYFTIISEFGEDSHAIQETFYTTLVDFTSML